MLLRERLAMLMSNLEWYDCFIPNCGVIFTRDTEAAYEENPLCNEHQNELPFYKRYWQATAKYGKSTGQNPDMHVCEYAGCSIELYQSEGIYCPLHRISVEDEEEEDLQLENMLLKDQLDELQEKYDELEKKYAQSETNYTNITSAYMSVLSNLTPNYSTKGISWTWTSFVDRNVSNSWDNLTTPVTIPGEVIISPDGKILYPRIL